MHGFADASLKGYGCWMYVRFREKDSLYQVSLVSAKWQVAPIKSQNIPRLELQAARLLKILVDKVYKDLKIILTIKSVTLSTDSTITLSWIKISRNQFSREELTKFTGVIEYFNMASYLDIDQLSRFDFEGVFNFKIKRFQILV